MERPASTLKDCTHAVIPWHLAWLRSVTAVHGEGRSSRAALAALRLHAALQARSARGQPAPATPGKASGEGS